LDAGLEGANPLWSQARIRNGIWWSGKSFLQPRLFVSRRIRKAQTSSRKNLPPAPSQQSQSDPRHAGIAEDAAVNEPSACNHRKSAPHDLLLQVNILIEPLAGGLRAHATYKSILVFDAISKRALRPAS